VAALPYMPLYVADYLADAAHLSTLEHGAYLLLIMTYWQRGKPLPAQDERLANIVRMPLDQWQAIRGNLAEFFQDDGGTWTHKRIEKELAGVKEKSEKARNAGKASAEAKANVRSTSVEHPSNHTDTDTDTSKKESIAQSAHESDWPKDFRERFWNEVPKKVDKGATLRKLEAIRKSGKVRFELLLSAMRLYAKSVAGSEPRFVKSPLVWLNKGCWDDELPAETRVFAAAEPTAPPGKIYLTPENPEWIRYAQTYRAAKGHDPPVGKQGGWYFDEIKAA
jgi:uncharacterized protein YdaU (DUF1376 family)